MFRNKRKTFGLFITDHFDDTFQSELCRGIVETARQNDINVAIFSMYTSYDLPIFDQGEMNVFELADISQLDGLIFATTPTYFTEEQIQRVKRLCERASCPAISLNTDFGFIPCVTIDNYHVLEEVIEHFVTDHGFTRIDFLSGTPHMQIAKDRLRCYEDCMKRHGLYDERRVFHGDFWRNKSVDATKYFLELEDELPQAIVCANDYSALVVCHELNKRGIRVPEDVAVTGCDDIEDAITYSPPLTTVNISAYSMGTIGVNCLLSMLRGEEIPHTSYCDHFTVYRESCGCGTMDKTELRSLRQRVTEDRSNQEILANRVMYLSIELQSAPDVENLYQQLSDFFAWEHKIKGFCICLSTDWKERGQQRESFGFTETVNMEMGIYNATRIPAESFSKKQLLPTIMLEDRPLAYIFSSVHYRSCCYGYFAFNYEDSLAHTAEILPLFVYFSNSLEAYRIRYELQQTVDELNTLYIHDSLSGLMNRRGFQLRSEEMYRRACEEGLSLFSFAADLDDLKYINDTYGHAQGDIALKRIAQALLSAAQAGEPCARIGGDEYAVFGVGYTQKDAENFAKDFLYTLERLNKTNPETYPAAASWGYVLYNDPSKFTIEEIMRATDERMYQMKIDHKNK